MQIDARFSKHPKGLILFIDDDRGEHELFAHALKSIDVNNEVKTFVNGQEAFEFLKHTTEDVFIIFCDINMPQMNGLEFKKAIEEDRGLKMKSIPFIFQSNSSSAEELRTAYTLNIQGFIKKGDFEETSEIFKALFFFWSNCVHPKDLAKL